MNGSQQCFLVFRSRFRKKLTVNSKNGKKSMEVVVMIMIIMATENTLPARFPKALKIDIEAQETIMMMKRRTTTTATDIIHDVINPIIIIIIQTIVKSP